MYVYIYMHKEKLMLPTFCFFCLKKPTNLQNIFYEFLLEYNCFTMLCQFLTYSKVNQLYIYIYTHIHIHTYIFSLFWISFPQVTTEHSIEFSVLYSRPSLGIQFIHNIVHMSIPFSQFIPPLFLPCYLYICSLCLCLYFCFANEFICIIFLQSIYK